MGIAAIERRPAIEVGLVSSCAANGARIDGISSEYACLVVPL
jgi:hypothetical protein